MTRSLLLGLFVLATASATAQAGDCCAHCGCNCSCRKVCRLICETKKVPKTTYDCKCEDFCVPGPSKCCGTKCVCECTKCGGCGCDACGGCGKIHCHKEHIYTPTCAEVRTKKVLIKHVEMVEKPSYKWVVEYLCDNCACKCQKEQPAAPPAGDDYPVPPAPNDSGPPPAPKDNTASKAAPADYYAGADSELLAPPPPPMMSKDERTEARGVSFMQSLFNRKAK